MAQCMQNPCNISLNITMQAGIPFSVYILENPKPRARVLYLALHFVAVQQETFSASQMSRLCYEAGRVLENTPFLYDASMFEP
jgi:hypothetical protein